MVCMRVAGLKSVAYGFIVADTSEMSSILRQSHCCRRESRSLPSLHIRGSAGGSQGSRKLTSAWRDIFFRIRVFFVRVVVGEPIFGWSIK